MFLITLLAEIENVVTSRPLTHVTIEPGSHESLTPNHFLIGTSSSLPTIGLYKDAHIVLRKQWRIAKRLADKFLDRWVKEILQFFSKVKNDVAAVDRNEYLQDIRVFSIILNKLPTAPITKWADYSHTTFTENGGKGYYFV